MVRVTGDERGLQAGRRAYQHGDEEQDSEPAQHGPGERGEHVVGGVRVAEAVAPFADAGEHLGGDRDEQVAC